MNNIDEILNKYIDNELTFDEINTVKDLTETNLEFKLKLAVHKFVHNSLYDIKLIEAPENITQNVMKNILSKVSVKFQKSYFFRSVVSILLVSILTIFFMIIFYPANQSYTTETNSFINQISQILEPIFNKLGLIFLSGVFKSIGGLLSFIILLSFYFNINSHKKFKEKLNNL